VLVEDNPADVGLVCKALVEHGVEGEIIIVSDGESAVRLFQYMEAGTMECPGLVILDLNLPKQSGREVLESIRCSEKCSGIAVIVLTSSDADRDRADVERLGASRYIRKPLRLQEFLDLGAIFRETLGK
jgi:DNA-binding response OmpR family regulator